MSARSRSRQLQLLSGAMAATTTTTSDTIRQCPHTHNQHRSFHQMAIIGGRGRGRGAGGGSGGGRDHRGGGSGGNTASRFSSGSAPQSSREVDNRNHFSSQSRGWQRTDSDTSHNRSSSNDSNAVGDSRIPRNSSNSSKLDQFPHYRDHHSNHRSRSSELSGGENHRDQQRSHNHSTPSHHQQRPSSSSPHNQNEVVNGAAHSAITSFKRSPLPQRTFHAAMQVLSVVGQRLLQCENDYQKTLRRNNLTSDDIAMRRAAVAAASASGLATTTAGLSTATSTGSRFRTLSPKTDLGALSSALAAMEDDSTAAGGDGEDWFHKLGRDITIDDESSIAQFGDTSGDGTTLPPSTKQEQYAAVEHTLSYIHTFLATFADFRIQVLNDSSLTLAERSNFYATCIGMLTEAVDVSRARFLTNQISHGTRSHSQLGGAARAGVHHGNAHTDKSNNVGGMKTVADESGVRQKFPPPNTTSRRSTDPPLPFISSALGCISEAKAFHIPLTVYHYLPLLRSQLLVRSDTGLPMRLLDDAVRTIKETIYFYGRGDVKFKRATLRHAQETIRSETELALLRKLAAAPPLLSEHRQPHQQQVGSTTNTDTSGSATISPLSREDASLVELLQNIGTFSRSDGDDDDALFNSDNSQHHSTGNGGRAGEAASDTSALGKRMSLAQLLSNNPPPPPSSTAATSTITIPSTTVVATTPTSPAPVTPTTTSVAAGDDDDDGMNNGIAEVIKSKFVLDVELLNAWDAVTKKKEKATKSKKRKGKAASKKQDPTAEKEEHIQQQDASSDQEYSPALDLEINEISLQAAHNEAEMIVSGAQIAVASGYAVAGKWEHALYCTATPSAFRKLSRNLIDSGRWEIAAELVAHLINQVSSTPTTSTTSSDSSNITPLPTSLSSLSTSSLSVLPHPLLTSLPLVECVSQVGREAIEGFLHSNEGGGGGGGFFVPPSNKDRTPSNTTSASSAPSPSAASIPASSIASVKAHRLENPCAMTRVDSPDATHIYGVLYDVAQRFGRHQWQEWEVWRREQASRGIAIVRRDSSVSADRLSEIASSYYDDLGYPPTTTMATPSTTTTSTTCVAPVQLPKVQFLSRTIVEGLVLAAPATRWDLGLRLLTAYTIHFEAKRQMMETNIIGRARLLAKLRMSSSSSSAPATSSFAFNKVVGELQQLNRNKERHEEVGKVQLGVVLRAFHRAHQWERVLQLYHDNMVMSSSSSSSPSNNNHTNADTHSNINTQVTSTASSTSTPSSSISSSSSPINTELILKSIFAVKPNVFDSKQTHWSVVDRGHVLLTLGQAVLYHGNALSAEGRSARTLPPGEHDDEALPSQKVPYPLSTADRHIRNDQHQSDDNNINAPTGSAADGWKDEDFGGGDGPTSTGQQHAPSKHKRYTAQDILQFLDGNFPGIHTNRDTGSQYSVHTHMAVINMLGRGGSGCPPGLAWERCLMSLHHVDPRANKSIDVVIWQLAQSGLWEQATKTFASFMRSRRAALSPSRHAHNNHNSGGGGGNVLTGSVSSVKYLWPQCSYMILASIYARQGTAQHIHALRKLQQQRLLLCGGDGAAAGSEACVPSTLSTTTSTDTTPMDMLLRLAEMGVTKTDHWNIMHVIACLLCSAPSRDYLDTYALPELRRRGIISAMAPTNPQFISLGNYFFKQLHDCAKFHCEQEWAAPNGADGTEYIHSLADIQLQPMRLLRRPPSEFADGLPSPSTTPIPPKTAVAAALQSGVGGSSDSKSGKVVDVGSSGGVVIPAWHLLNGPNLSVRVRRNALLDDRWAQALRIVSMLAEKPVVEGQATQYFETLPLLPACAAAGLPTSFFF